MTISFHPKAKEEFFEAINYYDECHENLGLDFAREIFRAIDNIVQFPEAWSILTKNTRRCIINRFPYGIIYQILQNEIIIITVMQLNRKPGYWENRTSIEEAD